MSPVCIPRTTPMRSGLIALTALLLAALAMPGTAVAQAHDVLRAGVPVGTPLPHNLEVPDQDDQVRSFQGLSRTRGLILIFSRSLSW